MKIRKTIIIVLALIIFSNINIYVYAENTTYNANISVDSLSDPNSDIIGTARNWIDLGKNSRSIPNRADWTSMNGLVNMLWGAGVFAVLIAGTILGIKYMLASAEEKASIKESMKPYIIGSIIILGALSIWKLCISVLETM